MLVDMMLLSDEVTRLIAKLDELLIVLPETVFLVAVASTIPFAFPDMVFPEAVLECEALRLIP